MNYEIVTTQEEKMRAMNIDASLSVTYMKFSADAHMSFAKSNIDCSSDVSVIVKASATGSKFQMGIEDMNILELDDSKALDMGEFTKLYGEYVIIGFEYG